MSCLTFWSRWTSCRRNLIPIALCFCFSGLFKNFSELFSFYKHWTVNACFFLILVFHLLHLSGYNSSILKYIDLFRVYNISFKAIYFFFYSFLFLQIFSSRNSSFLFNQFLKNTSEGAGQRLSLTLLNVVF